MDVKTYDKCAQDLIDLAHQIEVSKRPAYTMANVDVLTNFKTVAQRTGLTPEHVIMVYMLKHIDAICSFLQDPNIPQAEDMKGRWADAVNYLKLSWALVQEKADIDSEETTVVSESKDKEDLHF